MSGRALTDRAAFRRVPEEDNLVTEETASEVRAPQDAMPNFEPPEVKEEEAEPEELEPPEFVPMDDPGSSEPAPPIALSSVSTVEPEYAHLPYPEDVADHAVGENALELSNLSADIAIGRVRVVMLAALTSNQDCELVAETLIGDALHRGLSVVHIDAGSGRTTAELGVSDLSADRASFGDVVHRVREGLAEVPWGQELALERRSTRPLTLVEALTDIYEVVIVTTGRIGMASALPVFSGIPCRLVLVGAPHPDRPTVEAALEDAANLGYEVGQIVHPPELQVA
jgi:hypothetical protein